MPHLVTNRCNNSRKRSLSDLFPPAKPRQACFTPAPLHGTQLVTFNMNISGNAYRFLIFYNKYVQNDRSITMGKGFHEGTCGKKQILIFKTSGTI